MGTIRLLFAICVILAHTGPLPFIGRMASGTVAVQGFFILSGFYMALVLHRKYDHPGRFYWNRASRIFSGYWVALAAAVLAASLFGREIFSQIINADWDVATKVLMLAANVFLVGSDAMMFFYPGPEGLTFTPDFQQHDVKLYHYHYVAAAWSLPIEMAFYALAPFVVRSIPRLLVLAVAAVAVRLLTYAVFGPIDPWTYRFIPSEMLLFVLGALSYHLLVALERRYDRPSLERVGQVALVSVIGMVVLFEFLPGWANWSFYLILAAALPTIFLVTEANRLDQRAGDVTYMVYLVHMIIVLNLMPGPILAIALSILLALPLQILADRLDRWGRSLAVGKPLPKPSGISASESRASPPSRPVPRALPPG